MKEELEDTFETSKVFLYILTPLLTSMSSLYFGMLYGLPGFLAPPVIVGTPMVYYLRKREKQSLEAMLKPTKIRDLEEVVKEFQELLDKQNNDERSKK
ncbi:MAG: hypothetical protein OH354_01595 [Candidatus Parvarchaeota archaeon]|nr:hypothetical protein [Candidatus Jingweiarchaeum tengchongense]MCW1300094.1 hypothetical protein [Candidatus Jingweiarchaeum tengchongense]MCW1304448.1 hypothetical protein [Candidatus Jingweiarchaeum tengchongense]MCW1305615.1 hypothetical protein [Candidatus Jingweiarchaeum tengchongense]MCW1309264.1 hypothetical protein [Candidatus Jingweiarchaeum tengchongense]